MAKKEIKPGVVIKLTNDEIELTHVLNSDMAAMDATILSLSKQRINRVKAFWETMYEKYPEMREYECYHKNDKIFITKEKEV